MTRQSRSGTASGPAQPIPAAVLGRIQTPSPATGMGMSMAAGFNADHSTVCKIDKLLISLGFRLRVPSIQAL